MAASHLQTPEQVGIRRLGHIGDNSVKFKATDGIERGQPVLVLAWFPKIRSLTHIIQCVRHPPTNLPA